MAKLIQSIIAIGLWYLIGSFVGDHLIHLVGIGYGDLLLFF